MSNTEEVVKCPVCEKYEATIEEGDGFESRICLNCGYTTNNELSFDSEYSDIFEKMQPKIIQSLKFEDNDLKQYWYPFSMYVENKGALYPEGTPESWSWAFSPVMVIPIMERLQYPIDGEENKYHETRLAVEHAEKFATFKDVYAKLNGE